MLSLSQNQTAGLISLFSGHIPHHAYLQAILNGKINGEVFVDSVEHPQNCIVLGYSRLAFINNMADKKFLQEAINCLCREKELFVIVDNADLSEKLLKLNLNAHKINRLEFLDRTQDNNPLDVIIRTLPVDCKIQEADPDLLSRCQSQKEILSCYGSAERFFSESTGFCIIDNGILVSEAFAIVKTASLSEIIYFTNPKFRGKGYASILLAYLIRTLEAESYKSYCTCDENNFASKAIISKMGFQTQKAYAYWRFAPATKNISLESDLDRGKKLFGEAVALLKEGIAKRKPLTLNIISDSMAPILKKPDRFYAAEISSQELKCGDIIIFKYKNHLLAHRFLKYLANKEILTKGDAERLCDPPIPSESIVAKVVKIQKLKSTFDLNTPVWKKTNFLLGKIALLEILANPNIFLRLTKKLLRYCAEQTNPLGHGKNRLYPLENDFVFLMSSLKLNPEDVGQLNQYLDQIEDWAFVYKLILYNSLGPLIFSNLNKINTQALPHWIIDNLSKLYRDNSKKNAQSLKDIEEFLCDLSRENINVIVLKSWAIIEELYGDIALKPMEDIDLLVKKSDWTAIEETLRQHGFSNKEGLDLLRLSESAQIDMNWHLAYKNPASTKIEIKFHLFALDFPFFRNPEQYWQEAVPFKLGKAMVLRLSKEDHLLLLAARMMNVSYRQLLWFNELKTYLDLIQDINWEEIVRRSKKKRIDPAIYFAFKILKTDFNAKIPEDILEQLKPRKSKIFIFKLFFGTKNIGYRDPSFLRTNPSTILLCCLFLNKFDGNSAATRMIIRHLLRLMFPSPTYLIYRYKITKWQAYLGIGYIRRVFSFFK